MYMYMYIHVVVCRFMLRIQCQWVDKDSDTEMASVFITLPQPTRASSNQQLHTTLNMMVVLTHSSTYAGVETTRE